MNAPATLSPGHPAPRRSVRAISRNGTGNFAMSCKTSSAPAAPSEYGRRWRALMRREGVDYRQYRSMMGVCDRTARTHLDDGLVEPRASQIALACAAFGTPTVLHALFFGDD